MPRDRDEDDFEDDDRPRRRRDEDDDDDRPRRRRRRADDEGDATGGLIPYKNGKALAAYYCGVFGLIPCFFGCGIFGVVPIILGILGLKYANEHPQAGGKGHAITGIILGVVHLLWMVVIALYFVLVVSKK